MRSVQAGRIVHALLFEGPRGSGKRTMARLMAQATVCSGADKPCGVCPACKRFLAGSHPDVRVMKPEKRTIGVDEVRALIDALSLRTYEGGKHIVIIEQADRLTPPAQNALLKTLESPAGEALFFLITDAPGAMLPTIVSRCQTVRFHDLSVEECAGVLEARGIAPEKARELAGMAQGSVGRALEIDGSEAWRDLRARVLASLEALRGPASVAGAAAPLEGEKGGEDEILDMLELWARDLMAVQSGATPYQSQEAARLSRLRLDGRALLKGVLLARARLSGNVSWQNALESMFFQLIDKESIGRTGLSWQR
ncbi:MAG: DNA polymerase III subunit delta' [Clostridia bacterium]|nr:DNA polymerase III subunit delta' [Clostridia bacterium]